MQDKEKKVSQERRVFVKKVWIVPTLVAMGEMHQVV